jgi:hypothetical protein
MNNNDIDSFYEDARKLFATEQVQVLVNGLDSLNKLGFKWKLSIEDNKQSTEDLSNERFNQ